MVIVNLKKLGNPNFEIGAAAICVRICREADHDEGDGDDDDDDDTTSVAPAA